MKKIITEKEAAIIGEMITEGCGLTEIATHLNRSAKGISALIKKAFDENITSLKKYLIKGLMTEEHIVSALTATARKNKATKTTCANNARYAAAASIINHPITMRVVDLKRFTNEQLIEELKRRMK